MYSKLCNITLLTEQSGAHLENWRTHGGVCLYVSRTIHTYTRMCICIDVEQYYYNNKNTVTLLWNNNIHFAESILKLLTT